jgi:hypothetical protein
VFQVSQSSDFEVHAGNRYRAMAKAKQAGALITCVIVLWIVFLILGVLQTSQGKIPPQPRNSRGNLLIILHCGFRMGAAAPNAVSNGETAA